MVLFPHPSTCGPTRLNATSEFPNFWGFRRTSYSIACATNVWQALRSGAGTPLHFPLHVCWGSQMWRGLMNPSYEVVVLMLLVWRWRSTTRQNRHTRATACGEKRMAPHFLHPERHICVVWRILWPPVRSLLVSKARSPVRSEHCSLLEKTLDIGLSVAGSRGSRLSSREAVDLVDDLQAQRHKHYVPCHTISSTPCRHASRSLRSTLILTFKNDATLLRVQACSSELLAIYSDSLGT